MNIKPDLIECWPDTIDFPLHRQFLKENRDKFSKVIIVFTTTNWGEILIPEIKDKLKDLDITFIESPASFDGTDWRNNAVNKALKVSDSDWVWFTEQDFFPKDGFWHEVERNLDKQWDVFGVDIDGRLHPCCIFAKRTLIDSTAKDFSAYPDQGIDHFGMFQMQIGEYGKIMFPDCYYHMAGLTHNLYLVSKGEKAVYKPEEFEEYLEKVKQLEDSYAGWFLPTLWEIEIRTALRFEDRYPEDSVIKDIIEDLYKELSLRQDRLDIQSSYPERREFISKYIL